MDDQQRLKLNEMIKANDVEDQTGKIRKLKHSKKIKEDIEVLQRLKLRYQRLRQTNSAQYEQILSKQCNFLFTNYTDIFNKLKKDELDLTILAKFITVLEKIENSEIDQHEGSYKVGTLLKQIYIDSALSESSKRDQETPSRNSGKPMNWREFKQRTA